MLTITSLDKNLQARLVFLEQKEDEITKKLAKLTKAIDDIKELRLELERLMPPMRKALSTFEKFNETY